jgi:hypothetical protein
MEELGIISSDINQKLNQETDGGEE